ncbi:hypothetical protein [Candidatus Uabimicrobium amorphum]|uniref:Uncharacterized protein n=1 Tax=Uabimicrobium amorphum TaxID=2596890 RepID=A0A5S9F612_UABAM|nr:hypothetical protein [Candidatus Uabimicrobium amorphum]BBM86134.1 hypothetical protein UABAM_04520 [Candidatus Uabimicrobium amorphum]
MKKFVLLCVVFLTSFCIAEYPYYGPIKTVSKKTSGERYILRKPDPLLSDPMLIADGTVDIMLKNSKTKVKAQKTIRLLPGTSFKEGETFHGSISDKIPDSISVTGRSAVYAGKPAAYKAYVHFPDKPKQDATKTCKWIISHKDYATMAVPGVMAVSPNIPRDITIEIIAAFSFDGNYFEVAFEVQLLKLGITSLQVGFSYSSNAAAVAHAKRNSHIDVKVLGLENGFASGSGDRTPFQALGYKMEFLPPERRITSIALVAAPTNHVTAPKGYDEFVVDFNNEYGYDTARVCLYIKRGGVKPIDGLIASHWQTISEPDYTRIELDTNFGSKRMTDRTVEKDEDPYHGDTAYLFVRGGDEIISSALGNDGDYFHKDVRHPLNQKLAILKKEFEKAEAKVKTLRKEIDKIAKAVSTAVDYDTNKWDVRERIYNHNLNHEEGKGRWTVAWGRELTETDLAELLIAIGADISGGGGSATLTKLETVGIESMEKITQNTIEAFSNYLQQQANEIANDLQNDIKNLASDVIGKFFGALVKGKDPIEAIRQHFDGKIKEYTSITIHLRAGVAEYSGSNKLFGQTVTKTFSWQPFVAIRVVRKK